MVCSRSKRVIGKVDEIIDKGHLLGKADNNYSRIVLTRTDTVLIIPIDPQPLLYFDASGLASRWALPTSLRH
jgi:hypothetical protein